MLCYVTTTPKYTFPQRLVDLKIQFWSCPGAGHLHPIFKPHRGDFVWMPGPTVGHLQLFQNKMKNARQMPKRGMGRLGVDWQIKTMIQTSTYLRFMLCLSLKYAATFVFVRRPDVSSSTSNSSLSADRLDTPHTVYFLFINDSWVVCIRIPYRQTNICEEIDYLCHLVVKWNKEKNNF